MSVLLLVDFEKRYRNGAVVRARLSQTSEGFFSTVLFGPSGSGKTTILRCIAGLEQPERGSISLGNETWFDADKRLNLRPQARGIGFLFQDYALFPHLTIENNIGYGLPGITRSQRRARVSMLLKLLELEGLGARYPHQLSAGQQQRTALARAVAPRPRLLLLDEPLSALDAPTRLTLRRELRRILTELNTPTILVTHDPLEAVALADQAVILINGEVRQQGAVYDVFSRPVDSSVARIVGVETMEPGVVLEVSDGLAHVQVGTAELLAVAPGIAVGPVYICIRGEEVILERGQSMQTSARNRLAGRIVSLHPEGPTVRVILDCGFPLTALVTRPSVEQLCLVEGETVSALIKAPAIHLVGR